jgi:hypothetical protein
VHICIMDDKKQKGFISGKVRYERDNLPLLSSCCRQYTPSGTSDVAQHLRLPGEDNMRIHLFSSEEIFLSEGEAQHTTGALPNTFVPR